MPYKPVFFVDFQLFVQLNFQIPTNHKMVMKSGVEFGTGFRISHQHQEIIHHLFQVPFWELLFGQVFLAVFYRKESLGPWCPNAAASRSSTCLGVFTVGFWVVEACTKKRTREGPP